MNARADAINLEPGRDYIYSVDIESREFNGRWYTDVNVFRVQDYQGQSQNFGAPQQSYQGGYQNPQPQGYSNQPYPTQGNNFGGSSEPFISNDSDSDEDLPF